ncbi:hypothetical protein [Bacteroides helcogenes]|uniref:hypothetical protein n=1 Tax=Bacteroides helcogenes TaxID=290053 RepID=UPI002A9165C1|nr:hypothetical protein [Bacteroides helcogenes]MDY5238567.1 hypothetical protein [Bacteroides helcogenes]
MRALGAGLVAVGSAYADTGRRGVGACGGCLRQGLLRRGDVESGGGGGTACCIGLGGDEVARGPIDGGGIGGCAAVLIDAHVEGYYPVVLIRLAACGGRGFQRAARVLVRQGQGVAAGFLCRQGVEELHHAGDAHPDGFACVCSEVGIKGGTACGDGGAADGHLFGGVRFVESAELQGQAVVVVTGGCAEGGVDGCQLLPCGGGGGSVYRGGVAQACVVGLPVGGGHFCLIAHVAHQCHGELAARFQRHVAGEEGEVGGEVTLCGIEGHEVVARPGEGEFEALRTVSGLHAPSQRLQRAHCGGDAAEGELHDAALHL